jgi:hypothetical protein
MVARIVSLLVVWVSIGNNFLLFGGMVVAGPHRSGQASVEAVTPPSPHAVDDRRAGTDVSQLWPRKRTGVSGVFSRWLSLLVLAISLVLANFFNLVQAHEGSSEGDAYFAREGYFPELPPSPHAPEPRLQPCPPPLPGCGLSGGHIPVLTIGEYPRIPNLDKEGGLFDTWRPNLVDRDVPEEWDFQNLINTDRPDFTDATFSVGQGVALLETGYTFRKSRSGPISLSRQQMPESLLRVGVSDELELRVKWVGLITTNVTDHSSDLSQMTTGGDDVQLGFKYEIIQQEGWRPLLTYVGGAIIPSGTNGVSANQVQPFANLVYGWGIRRWLYLKGSTGVDFAKTSDVTQVVAGSLQEGPLALSVEDNVSQWHQSFSLLYQATPRVGGFWEWFSFFSSDGADRRASHYLDTGLYIYLTPNVQLDVRVGQRISNRVDTFFTGAGFSTRW